MRLRSTPDTRVGQAGHDLAAWSTAHLPVMLLIAALVVTTAACSTRTPAGPAVAADATPPATAPPITLVAWNIGLSDADPSYIADRLASFQDVDLWAISEVNTPAAVDGLEQAAETGEAADFASILGESGGGTRLLALYDADRFALLESYEIDAVNTTGNARAPLVLHLRDRQTGVEFLFMVNHLYRTRDEERHKQARLLNAWAAEQTLPMVAAGDYNFDWDVRNGARDHDLGYDLLTSGGLWDWIEPAKIVTTECSGWPCRYDEVLDFVFTAGPAQGWAAQSRIVVTSGDFPDDAVKSDHRPVLAQLWPGKPAAQVSQPVTLPPTPSPIVVPMPTPATRTMAARAVVVANANLRAGPGTSYRRVATVGAGETLELVGANPAGDWFQTTDGRWIAAFLVKGVDRALPVIPAP